MGIMMWAGVTGKRVPVPGGGICPKGYVRALLSVSARHSLTSARAWIIPLFSLSIALLLPAYVGLISRLISSMTDRSSL